MLELTRAPSDVLTKEAHQSQTMCFVAQRIKNQPGGIFFEFQAVFGALVFYIVRHGYLY
jgi:hypothetical protein